MRNPLEQLLTSKARAEILRLLFSDAPARLHLRDIARHSELTARAIRNELENLKSLGLVKEFRDGNRLYFSAIPEHPIYSELKGIVMKTVGTVAIFRERLQSNELEIAFVFGSLARGEAKATSDIDLIVIGELKTRRLFALLGDASTQLGREINPHVYTRQEFVRRIRNKDHFLTQVLDTPKQFIKGDERELERLAKSRLAKDA